MWMAKCIMCVGPAGYLYDSVNQSSLELKPGKFRSHLSAVDKSKPNWQWEGHKLHYEFIKYVSIRSFIRSL